VSAGAVDAPAVIARAVIATLGSTSNLPSPFEKRNAPRQPLFHEYHVEATAFLHEIVRTADCDGF
jgi:hypothetical protein